MPIFQLLYKQQVVPKDEYPIDGVYSRDPKGRP
jgi:hypothetical protein